MQKRVPSARLIGSSILPRYDLRFHKVGRLDGSGKCNVVPGGNGVYVAIFTIEESERSLLDSIEGRGNGYESLTIEAEGFGRCWSYIATPDAVDNSLRPTDWYKEMVRLGCLFHKFPREYIQFVRQVFAVKDLDHQRSHREWNVVKELQDGP